MRKCGVFSGGSKNEEEGEKRKTVHREERGSAMFGGLRPSESEARKSSFHL